MAEKEENDVKGEEDKADKEEKGEEDKADEEEKGEESKEVGEEQEQKEEEAEHAEDVEEGEEEGEDGGGEEEGDGAEEGEEGEEGEEEAEEEEEEETAEMKKASLERAADKGFELRKRGEDKWNLRIKLIGFKAAVTEENMEIYSSWFKERIDKEKVEHGEDFLTKTRTEVDFSQTGLDDDSAALLLKTLVECKVHVWLLKLFKNRLSGEGMNAVCKFLEDSQSIGTVREVHLSHNKFDNDSVLKLLRTLNGLDGYPPKKDVGDSDEAELYPVWVRLDKNKVEDPAQFLESVTSEGICSFCTASDREKCGTTQCCKAAEGSCPLIHLYSFTNQGFDGENPVGGPRAKGKGKEKRGGKGEGKSKGKYKNDESREEKGKGKGRSKGGSKDKSKGGGKEGRDEGSRGGGKGGSKGGSKEGSKDRNRGGYGSGSYGDGGGGGRGWDKWDDWSRYRRGGWDDNYGNNRGYSNRGWEDWSDKNHGGNWSDNGNRNAGYGNRGWGSSGNASKHNDDWRKGSRDDGYKRGRDDEYGNRGDNRGNKVRSAEEPRDGGWEEPRPPLRSKAQAWLG